VSRRAFFNGRVFTNIAESRSKIWFAGKEGILMSVNKTTGAAKSYPIGSASINHIQDAEGTDKLYCTTSAGELIGIDEKGSVQQLFRTRDQTPLFYIYEDRSGILWIESQSFGIVRFDPRSNKTEYLFPQKDYKLSPKMRNVSVLEDKKGTVWINLGGKVSFYNSHEKRMEPLSVNTAIYTRGLPKNISRMFYDKTGVLWVESGFDGIDKLMFLENDFNQLVPHPESDVKEDNEVRGILSDRNSRLWIGTKGGELLVYQNGRRIPCPLAENGINGAAAYAIMEDKAGRLWMGTKADGLFKASPVDSRGSNYVVEQYMPDKSSSGSISSNSIYCLLQDRKGRLWAGSYEEGLIQVEERNGKTSFKTRFNCFKNYPEGGFLKIRHMAEDAAGRIWIGTTAGLLIFNPDSDRAENYVFKQYKKEPGNINSLGGNDVQFILCDSKKQMWVLSTTGGLNRAIGNDPIKSLSFKNYSSRDGLPSDFLLSCAEDRHGNLWIATLNGISKFSIDRGRFQNFNYNDGLVEASFSEASCTKTQSGELVFGSVAGFLSFNPEKIQVQKITAPLVFTNFQVNSEDIVPGEGSPLKSSINTTKEIELKYDQNVLSIDFAVLDFHSVNKQNYAYRLVGFDNVWRSTEGQRRATYTKLPPGEYVFEVKSLNDELYKNVPFRSLQITILPPPWKTWWAYTIYLIIAAVAFVAARRVAITMLKLRQGLEVERKLADLKLNFFTQISHELRTPLTLIVNPSEEILEHEQLSGKGKEYMNVVVKNSRRMLRMVNQVLDLRKVQSGSATLKLTEVEINSFIRNLLDYFNESISHKKLKIEVDSNTDELQANVDAEKLEIVLYNLLANAIKFSSENSLIRIKVQQDEALQSFKIEVADEGPGVAETELNDIFKLYYEGKQTAGNTVKGTGIGLALSKELIELHGGKIYAEHNLPHGLRVIIDLKLGQTTSNSNKAFTEPALQVPEALSLSEKDDLSDSGKKEDLKEQPLLLIVEDNDDLRAFLASKFSQYYRIETAADGEEGFEKAKELLPDLVLSDIMMPKVDGIQLLDQLKNSSVTSHIPVVLLTARYSVESQVEALRYGADYYITKPFDQHLLQAAIESIIRQRKKTFQLLQDKEEIVPADTGITEYDKQFLEKILNIVESKLTDTQFNIDDVADSLGMSRSAFYRKFKSLTDTTPVEFVRETRLKKAKALMDAGEDNISVVAYSVGFNNPKYFSSCFKASYQQTPSEYVKEMKDKRRERIT